MITTVIPFFLLAKIATDNPNWKHGPEFVFSTKVNVDWRRTDNETFNRGLNLTNLMLCRPKTHEILSCQLDDIKLFKYYYDDDLKSTSSYEEVDRFSQTNFWHIPFEITFSKEGITNYNINRTFMEDLRSDYIKLQANLLSIGVNLANALEDDFDAKEDFLLGNCMTHFNLQKMSPEAEYVSKYKLDLAFEWQKKDGKGIKITKKKDLNNCDSFHDFFISRVLTRNMNTDNGQHAIAYENSMHLSDHGFNSTTHVKGIKDQLRIAEEYTISLTDIRPATSKVQEVRESISSKITARYNSRDP